MERKSRLHESMGVSMKDKYFICGTNPEGNGGGIIASCNDLNEAHYIQREAIFQNYSRVSVQTYSQLFCCDICGTNTMNGDTCDCLESEEDI